MSSNNNFLSPENRSKTISYVQLQPDASIQELLRWKQSEIEKAKFKVIKEPEEETLRRQAAYRRNAEKKRKGQINQDIRQSGLMPDEFIKKFPQFKYSVNDISLKEFKQHQFEHFRDEPDAEDLTSPERLKYVMTRTIEHQRTQPELNRRFDEEVRKVQKTIGRELQLRKYIVRELSFHIRGPDSPTRRLPPLGRTQPRSPGRQRTGGLQMHECLQEIKKRQTLM